MSLDLRVGQGWDIHALVPGRALRLGGVLVPYPLGLAGHSDADVLLHAITDALLGAAALGDIGSFYPDDDERWRGADSRVLLREVMHKIRAAGFELINVDTTVLAEAPRLRPLIQPMREAVAVALELTVDRVSIKAKTSEKFDAVGRGQAIAAQAVVLLHRLT
jgi:2-C-methyl-D-erythritol 2,4-cyclodiphosphate synthase